MMSIHGSISLQVQNKRQIVLRGNAHDDIWSGIDGTLKNARNKHGMKMTKETPFKVYIMQW